MKKIRTILILALFVINGIFILINYDKNPINLKPYKNKIDSLESANHGLKAIILREINKFAKLASSEDQNKKLADSLSIEIKNLTLVWKLLNYKISKLSPLNRVWKDARRPKEFIRLQLKNAGS